MHSESHYYDVLIVGAGNAACCAAFAALDQKARVGLIEKAPKRDRGGNSALTAHMRFVYNGIDDLRPLVKNMSEAELQKQIDRVPHRTEAEVYDEFMRVTDNQVDEPMLQVHVRDALNTVTWLAAKGHDWVPTGNVGDNILLMNGGGYHASPQDISMSDSVLPSVYAVGASTVDETNRYMYPYSIMVNVHGERFIDEASDTRGKTYAKMGGAILLQPGGIAFQIMDAKIRNRNLYFQSYSQATTAKANRLDALAEELGINAANFAKTVAAFNAAVQPGEFKPDRLRLDGKGTAGITPPKSNYALTIDEPPFEGWPVRCGITFTYGGLRIDPETAQVQHVAGRPIPGLYAAGEMVGGLFVGNYPSGSGMMAGAVFGRQAGIHAGKEAVA